MRPRLSFTSLLGHAFWLPALVAMVLGLWLPGDFRRLAPLVPVSLGGILYFTALKVELGDVTRQFHFGPRLMTLGGAAVVKLLAVPLACFAMVHPIAPDWALGVLIVMAMPAGMTSSAMADLYRADVPFVLALTLLTSVLCPITVPVLTSWFDPMRAHVDPLALAGRAAYIVVLLTVPFGLAQLTRRVAKPIVLRHHHRWGYGAMASTCLLIFFAIAANRGAWAALDGAALATPLALTGALMAGIATVGAFARRRAGAGRVDGLTYGCLWMNNGLAVAFCDRFFHGNARAMLPAIVIQLPIVASVAGYGTFALRTASSPIPGPQKTR